MSDTIRNKAIDGWRFLFALLIIWHHLPWVSGHLHELGYCAVFFFFIVSGYLSFSYLLRSSPISTCVPTYPFLSWHTYVSLI